MTEQARVQRERRSTQKAACITKVRASAGHGQPMAQAEATDSLRRLLLPVPVLVGAPLGAPLGRCELPPGQRGQGQAPHVVQLAGPLLLPAHDHAFMNEQIMGKPRDHAECGLKLGLVLLEGHNCFMWLGGQPSRSGKRPQAPRTLACEWRRLWSARQRRPGASLPGTRRALVSTREQALLRQLHTAAAMHPAPCHSSPPPGSACNVQP